MLPKIEISQRNKKIIFTAFSFLLLYGFIFLIIRLSQAMLGNDTPEKVGNVCSLDTAQVYQNACEFGFEQGKLLIESLTKAGTDVCKNSYYPRFEDFYPACQQYYDNSTLTTSCLSGQQSGVAQELVKQAFYCNQSKKNNQVAALSTLFLTVAFFAGKRVANIPKVKQLSEKIFPIEEKETESLLDNKL